VDKLGGDNGLACGKNERKAISLQIHNLQLLPVVIKGIKTSPEQPTPTCMVG
jgi:hypothetical protein